MYPALYIRKILTLFLVSLVLTSCNLFSSNSEQSDLIENGPFYYSLRGMTDADINCDSYSLITQWADIGDLGVQGEVQAGLHASVRDTVNNIIQWQRFNITFIRKNRWPNRGLYNAVNIEDVRRGDSDQFFFNFNSLYREIGLGDNHQNHVYIEDYGAFAESGSIEITTSDELNLRGTFLLNLKITEKRTWDGSEETVETSFTEQLEARGAFDIDLSANKVGIVSSLPQQEMTNMCNQ